VGVKKIPKHDNSREAEELAKKIVLAEYMGDDYLRKEVKKIAREKGLIIENP
jgi:hypothetical protein